ncbi:hypothetical protein N9L68_05070 [bacterium]|nr:hypothetical protein [bacterium]
MLQRSSSSSSQGQAAEGGQYPKANAKAKAKGKCKTSGKAAGNKSAAKQRRNPAEQRATAEQRQMQQYSHVITALLRQNAKTKTACSQSLNLHESLKRDMTADDWWDWAKKGGGVLMEDIRCCWYLY